MGFEKVMFTHTRQVRENFRVSINRRKDGYVRCIFSSRVAKYFRDNGCFVNFYVDKENKRARFIAEENGLLKVSFYNGSLNCGVSLLSAMKACGEYIKAGHYPCEIIDGGIEFSYEVEDGRGQMD